MKINMRSAELLNSMQQVNKAKLTGSLSVTVNDGIDKLYGTLDFVQGKLKKAKYAELQGREALDALSLVDTEAVAFTNTPVDKEAASFEKLQAEKSASSKPSGGAFLSSIRAKLLMVLLLLSLVPLGSLGFLNYLQTTKAFSESIQESLFTIVQTKNDRLEQYIDETASIGLSLASTSVVQQYISAPPGSPESAALASQVNDLLYSFQEANWGKYHHIFLIDQSQRIALSPNHGADERGSPSSHLGENTAENKWAAQAFAEGTVTVSDYSSWVESDHTHQMLFYPVKDSNGLVQAVIGFELLITHIQQLLQENFELGETGRIFLVTNEGVPIVHQGIGSQTPIKTAGFEEARRLGISSERRENASGKEVIDLYLANAQYPWVLAAEIEAREAFSSLSTIQLSLILALLGTLLFVILTSLFFTNLIVNPITKLTNQMEAISLGNIDIEIDSLERKDEIGKLAQAFDRMVQGIKMIMKQSAAD